jgi:DNA-binding CsgD family transcriptional regulator
LCYHLVVASHGDLRVSKMAQFNVPYVTPREKKLLRHFAEGKTDREIAVELGDRESRIAAHGNA